MLLYVQPKRRGGILIRALDIAIYLIIIQATIGFVNQLGIFDEDYYANQKNPYTEYRISSSEKEFYKAQVEEPSWIDKGLYLVELTIDGLFAILQIFLAVLIIFPTLINVFEVPAGLSVLMQVGIWMVYYLGWNQYRSGKSLEGYF